METSRTPRNYATDFGLISIRPRDAKLCACIVEETFDLIPYPNGWFGVGRDAARSLSPSLRPLAEMRFQTQRIDGRDVVVAMKDGKKILLGEKIPPAPVPEVWRKRVGRYELLNPDTGFPLTEPQVKLRDGQLCMSYKLPLLSPNTIQVPLQPISDTEAIILGLGRMRGETLRAVVWTARSAYVTPGSRAGRSVFLLRRRAASKERETRPHVDAHRADPFTAEPRNPCVACHVALRAR